MCVWEELEGEATPNLSDAESVAMTIYTVGALMAARTFERHEAIRTGALDEEDALSSERPAFQSLLLAGQGCEGIESGP